MQVSPAPPISAGDISHALDWISKSQTARDTIIRSLIEIEKSTSYREGFNLREEVTGPIVHRLFQRGEIITKKLANGMTISCRYTSKIARDFVMSHKNPPDHVWEPQTTRLLLHLAQNARQVVVGGAYFGDQSSLIAKEIASHGFCHCFELSAENSEMLEINTRQNNLLNVKINNVGLWSEAATLNLAGDDSHASPQASQNGKFTATTVDDYVRTEGVDGIDLLMLDIEGGEYEALRGAKDQLSRSEDKAPSVVFEVHSSYVDWSQGLKNTDIIKLMSSFGYTCYCIRDYNTNVSMAGRPIELIPIDRAYLEGPPHGFNVVAVKRQQLLESSSIKFCSDVSPKLLFHRDPRLHAPIY